MGAGYKTTPVGLVPLAISSYQQSASGTYRWKMPFKGKIIGVTAGSTAGTGTIQVSTAAGNIFGSAKTFPSNTVDAWYGSDMTEANRVFAKGSTVSVVLTVSVAIGNMSAIVLVRPEGQVAPNPASD